MAAPQKEGHSVSDLTSSTAASATPRRIPQAIAGIVLIAVWWPIAWLHLRPISDYYFFPLWLGYILTVDGLVEWRTGTSLWRRSHRKFFFLFVISMPLWWLFEWLNTFLQNWHYVMSRPARPVEYLLVASLFFSTVVPAVLETTELLASFHVGDRLPRLPSWRLERGTLLAIEVLGWVMLAMVILVPRYAFPLTWISVFFIIEPVNVLLGQRSIGTLLRRGNSAAIWNIMLATLTTGFFWEMWNSQAMPKWTYSVPFFDFGHVFEMPILGYLGYIPFGLEVFTVYALAFWLLERRPQRYARTSTPSQFAKV
jgi:hypothetical protein